MMDQEAYKFLMVSLRKGIVTEDQASEACRIVDSARKTKPLSFVMMDLGYISAEEMDQVVREMIGPGFEDEEPIDGPTIDEAELDAIIDAPVEDGVFLGRTFADAPEIDGNIYVTGEGIEVGQMVPVEIVESREYDLVGVYDPEEDSR